MFSEYRNSNRKNSDYSENEHENAFIQISNYTRRSNRDRSRRMKKMHYVGTFDDILLSIKLESLYLEETTPPMKRFSSPTRDHCFHCAHDHNQSCCLYFYDTDSDKILYSKWKADLEKEKTYYIRNTVPKIPEALSGNTTPCHFPGFTYNNPEFIETRIGHYTNQNVKHIHGDGKKTRWFRQFYYPLFAMDIIPTVSGIPFKQASVLPPPPGSELRIPPENRPLASLPPPPLPSPPPQPEPIESQSQKMCCNAHVLVKQHKNTKEHQNHYFNNNRYYHYHHHHYNNYNNYDNQQTNKFIPTKYFYNRQTTANQPNKQKKSNKPINQQAAASQHQFNHHNHNKQYKNHRYNKNKKNNKFNDYRGGDDDWNSPMGQISTNMIHELPYMYFY